MNDETADLTGNKTAHDDLRTSEIRYRRLFESARDGILILDAVSGKITDVNPFMMELLNYSREEFLGRELWQLGVFRDIEESKATFRELQEQGYIRYENMPLELKTGECREVEFVSNIYKEGERQVIQCNIRDNTEHKLLQEESEQNREWLLAIFEASQDGIVVEENDQIVYVNNRYLRMYGYDALEEVIGNNLRFQRPKDTERMAEYSRKRARGEDAPTVYEFTGICKDGTEMAIEASISTFTSNGKFYIVTAQKNITERKQAEEELRNSERYFRTLIENALDLINIFDEDGTIRYESPSIEQMLGYKPEERIGQSAFGLIHPDDMPNVNRVFAEALQHPGVAQSLECRIQHKDGSWRLWEVTGVNLLNDPAIAGIVVNSRDITYRKRADEALKASVALQRQLSERQSAIFDALPANICLLGGLGIVLEVNAAWRQFARMNHYGEGSFGIGSNYIEVCESATGAYSAEARQTAEGIRSVLSGKATHFELEYACHSAEEERWFRLMVTPLEEDVSAGAVVMHVNVTERKLAEDALRQAEAKYRSIVESLPAVIYLAQPFPPYAPIYVSPNITEFGYTEAEWHAREDMWMSVLHKEDRERVLSATETAMNEGLETELEYRIMGQDGAIYWVHDKGRFISDEQGNRTSWQGVMVNITKTKELEEQLLQSQKLESVGRLAGGIAHDFNNLLTAVNGYSELTLRRLSDADPLRQNIEEIKKAGQRAAALTHQLLAFSRQQILQPVVLDLDEMISDIIKMLQRLIGEDVQLVTVLNPKAGHVKVDPGQLSQIIVNLAVNARDAMPQGGKLTIETTNVFLGPDYASQHVGVLPGAYVMLSVSDTGTGMSVETQRHIFEPFFTTKEVGKGTGLGLATVYGIVKQSGGNISVYSEEGVGTTFKIYLPRIVGEAQEAALEDSSDELPGGTETILLVEDEEIVRTLTCQILEECGYTVLEAQNGVEALSMCETHDCRIDLLLTDVVMPRMGGRELGERFARIYPHIQILFTSGYTDDAVVRHGVRSAGTNFIQKPFTPYGLARKVREILDAPRV